MQRGNQRLPMLSIQNKNENLNAGKSKSKNSDQNCKFYIKLVMIVDDSKYLGNIKTYPKEDKSTVEANEKQLADAEYLKSVQKALQVAINENEEVSIIYKVFLF